MYPSIVPTRIGEMKGLVLENEKIRIVLTHEFGARILSLIYKPTETEFAWHNPQVPVGNPAHQRQHEDVSGFFECVPTCEGCTIKGRKLPMYGEVAFEPWRLIRTGKKGHSVFVKLQRKCEVYPIIVHKALTLSKNESTVVLNHGLTNLSDEVLEYHYSSHNTLHINPSYRIVLPHEVTKVKRGMAVTDRLGNLGDEIPWPIATDRNGNDVDLSKVGQPTEGVGENLYSPRLKESWAAAFNESRREAIGFSFDSKVVPYVLVWTNWGGYLGYYHIALEPTTGRPDNLEVAVNQWKNYAALEPKAEVSWSTKIFLNHNIKHIERIAADEGITQ